jgi:5-oxoprolinase (ATP-hydrolysing)
MQGKGFVFGHPRSLADHVQAPAACVLEDSQLDSLQSQLDELQAAAERKLTQQGFQAADVTSTRYLNLRFQGTDVALMVASEGMSEYKPEFLRIYKQEFGFVLQDRPIIVDDARHAHHVLRSLQVQQIIIS